MTNILLIQSSANLASSYSRRVADAVLDQLLRVDPAARVKFRDLAVEPPPHIDEALRTGWELPPANRSAEAAISVARSELYLSEVKAADIIVIGVPMYNLSLPTTLKAWIDHILIPGQAFRYTPEGPQGLLTGKRVFLALARGGIYSEGPAAAWEHQESYLRAVLGFMGLTDIESVLVEGVAFGPDQAAASLRRAMDEAGSVSAASLAA